MRLRLRRDLEFLRVDPERFLLSDPVTGEQFRIGAAECELLRLFDGERSADQIRGEFSRPLRVRHLREFAEQLRRLGLLIGPGEVPAAAGARGAAVPVRAPEPLGALDPGAALNRAFDVLALCFGWLFQPCVQVLVGLVVALAGAAVLRDGAVLLAELELGFHESQPLLWLPSWLALVVVGLGLPRELAIGTACRLYGGRVRAFRAWLAKGVLPVFQCDIGDSVAGMRPPQRLRTLLADAYAHAGLGALATLGWSAAPAGSELRAVLGLLVLPWLVGLVLLLSPYSRRAGYRVLCLWVRDPRLHERALAETRAFLRRETSPEPLADRERFWLRCYGLGHAAWLWLARALLVGLALSLAGDRYGSAGQAAVVAGLGFVYRRPLARSLLHASGLKWRMRHGGAPAMRWGARAGALLLALWFGLLPYDREVGGRARIVPGAEFGIRSQLEAEIGRVLVRPGQWVERGEAIAILDGRDALARVDVRSAEVREAEAALRLLRAGTREEEVRRVAAELETWRARRAFAASERERVGQLHARGMVSQAALQRAERDLDTARSQFRAAEEAYAAVRNGPRVDEVRAAEARLESARAALQLAREQANQLTLRSPIAGTVATPQVGQRVGQTAAVGDLVAVVQDTRSLRVEIAAGEAAAALVEPGMTANVRLYGLDGRLVTATVESISSRALRENELWTDSVRTDRESALESRTRLLRESYSVYVFARLDGEPEGLVPGMTGYARVETGTEMLWNAVARPVVRFLRTEVWSWLP